MEAKIKVADSPQEAAANCAAFILDVLKDAQDTHDSNLRRNYAEAFIRGFSPFRI